MTTERRKVEPLSDDDLALLSALRGLTSEDIAYLHRKRLEDDRASWVWQTVRTHAPWVSVVLSLVSSGIYWFLTHTISIGPTK